MVIKYQISPYPTLTENMWVRIWEAQSDTPDAPVYELEIPERDGSGTPTPGAGHQVPYTVTATGMDTVTHIVRLYTNSGTLLHEYSVEAKENLVTVFDPIRFKIGDGGLNTPTANTATYTNAILIGLLDKDYLVFRNNYGLLFPGIHYTNNPDTGGFTLAAPDIFNGDPVGEEFTILQQPQAVETIVNDSVVGKWFGGFVDVAANTSYAQAHLRKLIRFSGTCTYSFDSDPPIGYGFIFQHFGAAGTSTIAFNNAQLLWEGTPKDSLDIKHLSSAGFVFDGTNWNVIFLTQPVAEQTPGTILGVGEFPIGNIPAGDPYYDVVHNLNIVGDYTVQISIKGTHDSRLWDNDVIVIWYHHPTEKNNVFRVCMQEARDGVQNLSIAWLIIKM